MRAMVNDGGSEKRKKKSNTISKKRILVNEKNY